MREYEWIRKGDCAACDEAEIRKHDDKKSIENEVKEERKKKEGKNTVEPNVRWYASGITKALQFGVSDDSVLICE